MFSGPCLESLLAQSEDGFALGEDWELFLVDDGSTDQTRSIALALAGVQVLDPAPLPPGWTGKANAVWTAAQKARGEWLLFTDADTIHQPGDLRRALHEAEHAHVVMLSYSPKQEVTGFWQRALMPLIFAELALAYPPQKVSSAESRVAAANGQFMMVQRAAYFQVGGHATVAGSLLEDVDLAFLLKRRKYPIRFRYAPDALSTRMYRSFCGDAGRLDQKSGPPFWLSFDDGGREGSRWAPHRCPAAAVVAFFFRAAGSRRLGYSLVASALAILRKGGEIQFLRC